MSHTYSAEPDNPHSSQTWVWWEHRRLRYNVCLALSGWTAYILNAALFYGFGRPIWRDLQGALGMTLFLGTAFLVLMGMANICYLLGAWSESVVAPNDRSAFRARAFGLGFWGSLAVPFLFPLANLSLLVAQA